MIADFFIGQLLLFCMLSTFAFVKPAILSADEIQFRRELSETTVAERLSKIAGEFDAAPTLISANGRMNTPGGNGRMNIGGRRGGRGILGGLKDGSDAVLPSGRTVRGRVGGDPDKVSQIAGELDGAPIRRHGGRSGGHGAVGEWRTFGKVKRFEVAPEEDPNHDKYPEGRTWIYSNYSVTYRADMLANATGLPRPPQKYYLSVIAVFKNEGHIMQEWFEHHINHGVEHFYMVDDHSTDESAAIITEYRNYITRIKASKFENKFRQAGIYKNIVIRILASNESKWVAMLDLDEFLYSPQEVDVRKILRQHEALSLIGLSWVWFGSNGHVYQPNSVVDSFTMRADYDIFKYEKLVDHYKALQKEWQKYIINLSFRIEAIDVHYAFVEGTSDTLSYRRAAYAENPVLLLNHYSVQSLQFLHENKGKRGSTNNHFKLDTFHLEWYKMCDINDFNDTRLADQNRKYGIAQKLGNFSAYVNSINDAADSPIAELVPYREYIEQIGTEHPDLRKYVLEGGTVDKDSSFGNFSTNLHVGATPDDVETSEIPDRNQTVTNGTHAE